MWAEKKKKRKHTIFCDDCRSKISKEKHAQWNPFASFGALRHLLAKSLSQLMNVCTLLMQTEVWGSECVFLSQKIPVHRLYCFFIFIFIWNLFILFYYWWIGHFTVHLFTLFIIIIKLKLKLLLINKVATGKRKYRV